MTILVTISLEECTVKFLPEIVYGKRTLISGDNIAIMKKLLDMGYRGKFKMIYFDGPFNSGLLFTMNSTALGTEYIQPSSEYQSIREYLDLDFYLKNYRKRMELAKQLLHDEGFFVLQINQMAGHYVKVLLDQVFGRACFLSEAIWKHSDVPWTLPERGQFGYQHESLFFYSKTERFQRKDKVCPSVWDDMGGYEQIVEENINYPSQKPQKLIERILDMTTVEGDLVGDFYCGSGTFPLAAERMGRKWVACDYNHHAIAMTKIRFSQFGISLSEHFIVDDYNPLLLKENKYIKKSPIPVCSSELKGIPKSDGPVVVRAAAFSPDVDMVNEDQSFTFEFIFPDPVSQGIHGTEEISLPRPIPFWEAGQPKLLVPQPLKWVLYHLVHVERNEYGMIRIQKSGMPSWLSRDRLYEQAEAILKRIDGNWVQMVENTEKYCIITDVFGYKYQVPCPKS